jgi:hypothetical protein
VDRISADRISADRAAKLGLPPVPPATEWGDVAPAVAGPLRPAGQQGVFAASISGGRRVLVRADLDRSVSVISR